uniref:Uncharacterized protein n=1 Tax=Glossina palpalis gambiensis TaxID=67801 RepID=A0A1B0C633_9MUSC
MVKLVLKHYVRSNYTSLIFVRQLKLVPTNDNTHPNNRTKKDWTALHLPTSSKATQPNEEKAQHRTPSIKKLSTTLHICKKHNTATVPASARELVLLTPPYRQAVEARYLELCPLCPAYVLLLVIGDEDPSPRSNP